MKQHLAAIRHLFDWLVTGQVVPVNPAASVRGPAHIVRQGKTPVLEPAEARALLDSIDATTHAGLRDRALIGADGLFVRAHRRRARHEGRGRVHPEPPLLGAAAGERWQGARHALSSQPGGVPDAYLEQTGIMEDDPNGPLFRTIGRGTGRLTTHPLPQANAYAMIRRRAEAAGIKTKVGNHSFRATGITAYLKNGGTLEKAAAMANYASTRTTQLYDRRRDEMSLDEVERIRV